MEAAFFEGAEKKVALTVSRRWGSLRSLGEPFFRAVVEAAGAKVVSAARAERADAYLLSESSLFVFDDRLRMITCGRTRLVDAALMLVERLGRDAVTSLVYERQSARAPSAQPTSFADDVRRLEGALEGEALRFGDRYGEGLGVFRAASSAPVGSRFHTHQVLMHGVRTERLEARCAAGARDPLGLAPWLDGFATDERFFEPSGYSLNALRDDAYAAVHVTPDARGGYASFELGFGAGHRSRADDDGTLPAALDAFVCRLVEALRPRSIDVVRFAPTLDALADPALAGYEVARRLRSPVRGLEAAMYQLDASAPGRSTTCDAALDAAGVG
ncbi:MAG: hypothetical protein KC543_05310 [Myxococcales bacterium]|nr:hypothetical protein [Myxococcales bacterium]